MALPSSRLFFLDQHGCAKNQVDAELLIHSLAASGWERTDVPEDAALIIINSCGFIEDAKKESLDSVMTARAAYPGAKILLAGCLAERYADSLAADLPEADGIFGNGDLSRIGGVLESLFAGERPVLTPPQQGVCCGERSELLSFPGSAYVKITEGCDNRCSFCAIPLIRGSLRSRSVDDIVREIAELVGRGVREINLIGQDLASFGKDTGTGGLADLLGRISALSGDFWVRLLYIHPDNFPLDILPVMQRDERLLPYFDIPFQSGDADVLRAMNRRGSADAYLSLAARVREALPAMTLRTTFLTGFPCETDGQFENTVSFLEALKPDWSGAFSYSREDDTPAASMKKQVPARTARARKEKLEVIQSAITAETLRKHLDTNYDIIIEEIIEGDEGLALGRTWFQAPEVDGAAVLKYEKEDHPGLKPGDIVSARVIGVNGVDLEAIIL